MLHPRSLRRPAAAVWGTLLLLTVAAVPALAQTPAASPTPSVAGAWIVSGQHPTAGPYTGTAGIEPRGAGAAQFAVAWEVTFMRSGATASWRGDGVLAGKTLTTACAAQDTGVVDRLAGQLAPATTIKGKYTLRAGGRLVGAWWTEGAGTPVRAKEVLDRAPTARFNSDDGVEFKTTDLATCPVGRVKELATADRDGDGWVTSAEVLGTQGMSAGAYFDHEGLVSAARKRQFGAISVAGLRAKLAAGETVAAPRPARLGRANAKLARLPRSAFVPLADHLASRIAGGASYDSSYGNGEKVYHTDVTDVWRGHSPHELYAALSILTAREGGVEFGLAKREDGTIHLVQGLPDKLELDSVETGLDLILHTHPCNGAHGARPSQGDYLTAAEYDPDHIGRVVSDDGWFAEYRSLGGNSSDEPTRLWGE